jgi:hypothetical protein
MRLGLTVGAEPTLVSGELHEAHATRVERPQAWPIAAEQIAGLLADSARCRIRCMLQRHPAISNIKKSKKKMFTLPNVVTDSGEALSHVGLFAADDEAGAAPVPLRIH